MDYSGKWIPILLGIQIQLANRMDFEWRQKFEQKVPIFDASTLKTSHFWSMQSGDLNSNHSYPEPFENWTFWRSDFNHLKSGQFNPIFECLGLFRCQFGFLSSEIQTFESGFQMVGTFTGICVTHFWYMSWGPQNQDHSKDDPVFNHSKSWQVEISDPHCSLDFERHLKSRQYFYKFTSRELSLLVWAIPAKSLRWNKTHLLACTKV